jgi:prepilin-type N-terminal cleavage/methylation domain-containing protein
MFVKPVRSGLKKLTQRGDTLVEVLIAIAVISSVLAGAYVVTNKSLTSSRDAQERGNALKLSEGQLERVKTVVTTNPDAIFGLTAPNPFCINSANTPVAISNSACQVNALGVATSGQPQYRLSIQRSGNVFTLTTIWDNVRGTGTSKVELSYKAYR